MINTVGKAYGFFSCKAEIEGIREELPILRECAQTPNELELSLMENTGVLKGDPELRQLAGEAQDAGRNYVLEATYPNASNHQTADELTSIFNQMYPLYDRVEEFEREVVYEEDGRYLLARD